jgi:hypothetical protein
MSLPLFDRQPAPKRTLSNSRIGKRLEYRGTSKELQKQYSGVILTVIAEDGAFAQCEGDNGRYYSWVPISKCLVY